jgi:hypothetical protein
MANSTHDPVHLRPPVYLLLQPVPGTCGDTNTSQPGTQPYSCPAGSVADPTSSTSSDLTDDECCLVSDTLSMLAL